MSRRYYANAAPQAALNAGINSTDVTLVIAGSFAGWPAQFPFFAALEYGTPNMEIVSVTNIVGTTATIVRHQDGTAAISHNAGATLDCAVIRQDFDEANAHTSASAGVHGVTGAVVGATDVQTLTNKTLTAPEIDGGTVAGAQLDNTPLVGDATHPAVKATASVAGGKIFSGLDHTNTEKASVSDVGDAVFAGSVTAASVHGQGAAQPGMVTMWGGVVSTPPAGWLSCNGTAVLRSTYAALFAVIGTRFGVGDGSTTFNLPNVDGSFPFGTALDAGVGVAGGAASHTHTLSSGWAEVSAGTSTLKVQTRSATSWTDDVAYKTLTTDTPGTTHSIGAQLAGTTDGSVAALPPYVTFGFIIKY